MDEFRSVQILGVFFDSKELDSEVDQFFSVAEKLQQRNDLYFGMIRDNQDEIKKIKSEYGSDFFDDYSLSSVIIQRAKKNYIKLDISDIIHNMQSLEQEIQCKALKLVDEFTMQNYECYNKLNKPVLVAVVDSIVKIPQTLNFIYMMEDLAEEFIDKIYITWVEGNINPEKSNKWNQFFLFILL